MNLGKIHTFKKEEGSFNEKTAAIALVCNEGVQNQRFQR